MKLSNNFTLSEFTKSQTAARQDIDNTPRGEHLDAAEELFKNVVQISNFTNFNRELQCLLNKYTAKQFNVV